jgi:pilus assembly protein FimV
MIVLDRLVRSLVAPPSWKSAVLTGSIAMLAVVSLDAQAQHPLASSHATHAAGVPGASGAAGSGSNAAPASGAAADSGNAAAMPDHYQVQKGQWLTDIAGELTDSTDPKVKQTMANALYAANPDAFFANNPNRLKIGAVLKVPHLNAGGASGAIATTAASSKHAASAALPVAAALAPTGTGAGIQGMQATPHAASTTGGAATVGTAGASASTGTLAGAAGTTGAMAASAQASSGSAAIATPASTTGAAPVAAASGATGEGGASAAAASSALSASASIANSPVAASAAAASDAAASAGGASMTAAATLASGASTTAAATPASEASATVAASGAHAWTGAIAPAPAPTISASAADTSAASSPAVSQNVSSLQQLLQLKNRVLAAMQSHGLGSQAAAPASATLPASTPPAAGTASAAAPAVSQPHTGALQGPLAIPALLVVLVVVALAIWLCLPARKRKPAPDLAPPVSSPAPQDPDEPDDGGITGRKDDDRVPPHSGGEVPSTAVANATAAAAATTGIAAAAYAAQGSPSALHDDAADADDAVDAVDEASAAAADTDTDEREEQHPAPAEPPFSFEEGATGGLPTHDPQRRVFAEEARTPYDTGLLLGLLEMHAHRREVERFAELANELWELTDGDGPDWQRAAAMGRGIDPDNPLYADDPYAAYRSEHNPNSGFAKPLPDIDLDLPEVPPFPVMSPVPDPASFVPDATRDSASPSSREIPPMPEATPPAHVPVSEAHERLPLGLTDVDQPAASAAAEIEHGTSGAGSVAGLGAGAAAAAAAVSPAPAQPATPGTGAPNFGALKLDFDLELTPNAAAPGSSPTSHDLATIARNKLDLAAEYIDLGDRAGARTLLNEVLATQDPATRERAQALLATLA